MKNIPTLYKLVFERRAARHPGARQRCSSRSPSRPAARACWRSTRVNEIDDEFTRKGLQLVVDGIDPELVRDVLEAEIDGMVARHQAGAATFEKAGGFAPTMGIIGTVMGLVHVLQNLSAPATLGPAISERVHRHADGRRLGQRHLPAGRQPAQGAVGRGGRAAHADARRDPRPSRPATTRASSPRSSTSYIAADRARQRRRRRRRRRDAASARRRPRSRWRHGAHRRRRRGAAGEHENEERWLLTYSDMITLLMALFMVLFSISSVNISKYQTLQQSLQGGVLGLDPARRPGDPPVGPESTAAPHAGHRRDPVDRAADPDEHARSSGTSSRLPRQSAGCPSRQQRQLKEARSSRHARSSPTSGALKHRLNAYAKAHGLAEPGQGIRSSSAAWSCTVLTDKLLFASGQATLQPAG